jgi:hypothetical protein
MQRLHCVPSPPRRFLRLLLMSITMMAVSGSLTWAASSASGALFPTTTTNTTSAAVQVDTAGGMHVAYSTDPEYQATYAYCAPPSDCSQATNWIQAIFQNNVHEVQIALTPQGHPRMLLTIDDYSDPNHSNGLYDTYWYAQCDTGCTNSSNWATTFISGTANIASNLSPAGKHFFALDPQGQPRFVFGPSYGIDSNFQSYSWMNYATCDNACTATGSIDPATGFPIPTNWSFGKISATLTQPALAFTSAGRPRVMGFTAANDGQGNDIVSYSACDTGCLSSSNWGTTTVGQPGLANDEVVSLRLDSHDRPRIALYFLSAEALYGWCNANCLSSTNWASVPVVPTAEDGGDPDLQLDSQDHPRIAFHTTVNPPGGVGVGLGYAWCDANCESSQASFQRLLVENSNPLNRDWPLVRPANCIYASWLAGYLPSLALDAAGNPRIASDSLFVASGCPDGTEDLHTGVRVAYFNQGETPSSGDHHVFVSMVRR